jgi:hypothetical protein
MRIKTKTVWAGTMLGIMLALSGCGYLESKEDLAAWVKESMKAEVQKNQAYNGLSVGEVALVRESAGKFTGYVEFTDGTDTEKTPVTVTVDGNQKLYQCEPPRALIMKKGLQNLGDLFNE